jgi:hypothetical protein
VGAGNRRFVSGWKKAKKKSSWAEEAACDKWLGAMLNGARHLMLNGAMSSWAARSKNSTLCPCVVRSVHSRAGSH